MLQAMPNHADLCGVMRRSERTVAGYEVLLWHYRKQRDEADRLRGLIRAVIGGVWSVTELQEAIGELAERKATT